MYVGMYLYKIYQRILNNKKLTMPRFFYGVIIDLLEEGLDSLYREKTKECDLSFLLLVSSLVEVKQNQDLIHYKESLRLKADFIVFPCRQAHLVRCL